MCHIWPYQALPSGISAPTLTQTIGYSSIVAPLGCPVTGLVLLPHRKTKPYDTAEEIASRLTWTLALISSLTVIDVPVLGHLSSKLAP